MQGRLKPWMAPWEVCDLGHRYASTYSKDSKLQQEELNWAADKSHFPYLLSPCITNCPSPTFNRMSALGSQDVAWYEAFVWANIGFNPWRGEGSLPLTPYLNVVYYPGWFKPLDGSNSLFILEHRRTGYHLNLPKDSVQLVPLSMQRELSSSGVPQALVLVLNSFSKGNQDSN